MLVSRVTQSSGVELYLCSESSLLTVSILHCNRAEPPQSLRDLPGPSRGGPFLKFTGDGQQRQRAGLAGTFSGDLTSNLLVTLRDGLPQGLVTSFADKSDWSWGWGAVRLGPTSFWL